MENASENKVKRNIPKVKVPELLLAYTYFLNNNHSSHISIGYDNENFHMKIILYKNSVYEEFNWDDWFNIFLNKSTIQNHFDDIYSVDFVELPKSTGKCSFKLSVRNNAKCLISMDGVKKIVLDESEWQKLFSLIPFIHSIAYWYSNNWSEIHVFYLRYLKRCMEKNTFKLQAHEFFVENETFESFNTSRLFNEIPTISKRKLVDNIYQQNVENICST